MPRRRAETHAFDFSFLQPTRGVIPWAKHNNSNLTIWPWILYRITIRSFHSWMQYEVSIDSGCLSTANRERLPTEIKSVYGKVSTRLLEQRQRLLWKLQAAFAVRRSLAGRRSGERNGCVAPEHGVPHLSLRVLPPASSCLWLKSTLAMSTIQRSGQVDSE